MAEKRAMTADDLYQIAYVEDPRISPDRQWIAYVHMTVDKVENDYKRNIWLAPTDGGEPLQLTRGGKDTQPRWSPDGGQLAFTSKRDDKPQVYVLRVATPGGDARALTSAENGASSPAWSPDGQFIAYLAGMNAEERAKEDRGEEDEKPADKFEAKQRKERKEHDEKKRWDPYPAWRIPYRQGTNFVDDRYQQIYVALTAEGLEGDVAKPRRLTDVDADYSQPQWTPDGEAILTARTLDPSSDEPWRKSSLYRIRVGDGEHEQLTDESHVDGGPLPSPDGKWIAYYRVPADRILSTRLAVIATEGGDPRDLTLELDRSAGDFKWSADSSAIIFNANNWGDSEIYRVAPSGGAVEKLIGGTFQSEALDVSSDGSIAYSATTPVSPPELYYWAAGADSPQQMTSANKKFLDERIVQETHELRFTPEHGTEIQGWYILPVGYEEGKKYPLAFNIHGGPFAMWGPSTKTMFHEWQFHAARGYAVFYCNPRGSDGYGDDFMHALHSAWGDVAFTDLMAGVDTFLEKGIVDEARMAVTGGSYGGYMTGWIVGHTDRFKSAVTQRGVYTLPAFYGVTDIPALIELGFDTTPWENMELLWQHSPLAYAHNVKTPLLIIHSENDFRVPIADAEQLFAVVRRATDTPVKLLRYPRDGHELSRSGEPEHRVSRLTEMIDWFDEYCMSDND